MKMLRGCSMIIVFDVLMLGCGQNDKREIIIFHAGSLSVPMAELEAAFEDKHPHIDIVREATGSVDCARKITELNKSCDIMASADVSVIDTFLIPEYATWNLPFAGNEMVIAFTEKSRYKESISNSNWHQILAKKDVYYGRSDPDADPCGYRSVLSMKLQEKRLAANGLTQQLMAKDQGYIRPKETDLLGLLESHAIDYIFIYRSVAEQHKLPYLRLSDSVNLSKPALNNWYSNAEVAIAGNKPGQTVQMQGQAMVYSTTLLNMAPNPEDALSFLQFMLNKEGRKIIKQNGQNAVYPKNTNQIPEKLLPLL